MSLWLMAALGLLTYASRVAALVFLPRPSRRSEAILKRVPAPLFAGFAALTLLNGAEEPSFGPSVVAVLGALAAARSRSLLLILAVGLAGYLAATWLSRLA